MPTCHDWMFQCTNDRCVPHWWKCDGVNGKQSLLFVTLKKNNEYSNKTDIVISDCGDNSDEFGCTNNATISPTVGSVDEPIETDTCLKNQFMCDSGRCISKAYVCDGFPDCTGGEDETNCPKSACGKDKFRCRGDGVCLDRVKYCDGIPHCVDGSDEENCKQSPKQ